MSYIQTLEQPHQLNDGIIDSVGNFIGNAWDKVTDWGGKKIEETANNYVEKYTGQNQENKTSAPNVQVLPASDIEEVDKELNQAVELIQKMSEDNWNGLSEEQKGQIKEVAQKYSLTLPDFTKDKAFYQEPYMSFVVAGATVGILKYFLHQSWLISGATGASAGYGYNELVVKK